MIQPPLQVPFSDKDGNPEKAWLDWASETSRNVKFVGSDTTANRPLNGLVDGDTYLDTTLGIPIWYYGAVWIDATGSTV